MGGILENEQIALIKEVRCCICETTENLRIAPIMTGDRFGQKPKHPVCSACFGAWHDGAGTTPEQILAYREKHG